MLLKDVFQVLVGFLLGFGSGIVVTRYFVKKYVEQGNFFDENMIKTMMQSMGRTPSQKQVNQVMTAMRSQSKKKKK